MCLLLINSIKNTWAGHNLTSLWQKNFEKSSTKKENTFAAEVVKKTPTYKQLCASQCSSSRTPPESCLQTKSCSHKTPETQRKNLPLLPPPFIPLEVPPGAERFSYTSSLPLSWTSCPSYWIMDMTLQSGRTASASWYHGYCFLLKEAIIVVL